jgi:8-oxo-dGTP pyrophosphatase MutT (NUDIX family)
MMLLATLCYIKRDGHTLMVYRNKKPNDIHQGKWNGLGGKFEAGETPEGCVRREVQEETGLLIQNPRLHGLLSGKDSGWRINDDNHECEVKNPKGSQLRAAGKVERQASDYQRRRTSPRAGRGI